MNEIEYIVATNRVKVSMARRVLADVLSGENYGVSDDEKSEIMIRLTAIEQKLFDLFEIEE